jgi:hypothetical protein
VHSSSVVGDQFSSGAVVIRVGCEAANIEFEGYTALETDTRRLMKKLES